MTQRAAARFEPNRETGLAAPSVGDDTYCVCCCASYGLRLGNLRVVRMPEYRRNRVPGGSFFFTVNLLNRSSRLLVDEVDTLRLAVRAVKARLPFHVDAWAVLPDHMHCVWTLPSGEADFSDRWRRIKAAFSQKIARGEIISASRRCHSERGIWQRRYWEHTIRDDRDYATHVDYTHFNPVKHGLVERASDWQFSSFRRCVARGVYAPDWDCVSESMGNAGEREQ